MTENQWKGWRTVSALSGGALLRFLKLFIIFSRISVQMQIKKERKERKKRKRQNSDQCSMVLDYFLWLSSLVNK